MKINKKFLAGIT